MPSEDVIDARVVLCTFPSAEVAESIGGQLVDEHLAACVSLLPQVTSIYRWQGTVHREQEVLAIVKTTAGRLASLTARLLELHPYDTPEIIALDITAGHPPYLAWLADQTT